MHAEIIAIGDELTSGQRLDTNSQWLSQRLGELGIRTLFHTTVGDDLEASIRVFREAADRADPCRCELHRQFLPIWPDTRVYIFWTYA